MIAKIPAPLSWKITLTVALVFAAFSIAGILHHELWLDEAHHWLLATNSNSIGEMLSNARYEGHPALWNVLLFGLSRFTSDPLAMQLLNVAIIISAVILLLRFAPFQLGVKLGIVFSYFIFYEYSIISRNYALAFLLLVIVCILFHQRQKSFLLFAVMLVLLSQVHLFAAIIAGGFFAWTAYEYFFTEERKNYNRFYPGALLLLVSFGLVICQVIPPHDHFLHEYDNDKLLSFKRMGKAASIAWKGFFPLPDFGSVHPWNSNLVVSFSKELAIIPALLAWFIPLILLRNKKVRFFFYGTAVIITAFIFLSPLIAASRHNGFLFLLLIAALWMENSLPGVATNDKRKFPFFGKAADPVLVAMLFVQFVSGTWLYYTDWNRPFSNGKAVAAWIDANVDSKKKVVINHHFSGPPVKAYLNRELYYIENNAPGTFCKWNTKPFMITQDELCGKLSQLVYGKDTSSLWLVSNEKLEPFAFKKYPAMKKFNAKLVKAFTGSMVQAEDYWIYSITPRWEYEKHIY